MPQVKLTESLADDTGSYAPGDLYTCSQDTASRLIDRGMAVKVARRKRETASIEADETTEGG